MSQYIESKRRDDDLSTIRVSSGSQKIVSVEPTVQVTTVFHSTGKPVGVQEGSDGITSTNQQTTANLVTSKQLSATPEPSQGPGTSTPQPSPAVQSTSHQLSSTPYPVPSTSASNDNPPHYLEYHHSQGGFGNNFYGLISAFVMAAVMNYTLTCTVYIPLLSLVAPNYGFDVLFSVTDIQGRTVQLASTCNYTV